MFARRPVFEHGQRKGLYLHHVSGHTDAEPFRVSRVASRPHVQMGGLKKT